MCTGYTISYQILVRYKGRANVFHLKIIKQAKEWQGKPGTVSMDQVDSLAGSQYTGGASVTPVARSAGWVPSSGNPPPATGDLVQALTYRVQYYQADEKKHAGTAKGRRIGRVLKAHQEVLKMAQRGQVPAAKLSSLGKFEKFCFCLPKLRILLQNRGTWQKLLLFPKPMLPDSRSFQLKSLAGQRCLEPLSKALRTSTQWYHRH